MDETGDDKTVSVTVAPPRVLVQLNTHVTHSIKQLIQWRNDGEGGLDNNCLFQDW